MHTPDRPDVSELKAPSSARVVVVGGANLDTVGFSDVPLVAGDSNPGRVRSTPGGVGRNIAENLARLGLDVQLVTALGDDAPSRDLAASAREAGIGLDGLVIRSGVPCPRYLAIDNERHELAVAISDMRALEALTPERLAEEPRAGLLAAADVVVVDANLSAQTIAALPQLTGAPLVLDTVSVAKAPRLEPLLSRAAAIKPNGLEAARILGRPVDTLEQAEQAARSLVERGVGSAFVTPVGAGIGWADTANSGSFALPDVQVANTIGAGDSFVAGLAYALLAEMDTLTAARFASACSAITLASEDSVSDEMGYAAVILMMEAMYRE